MRLDRQITLKIAAPLLNLRKRQRPGIPILMYHSISQDDETGVHPYYRTTTSPDVFAQHMQFLRDNNYTVISLSDAAAKTMSWAQSMGAQPVLPKYVVITFDDGYRDLYLEAFPILQQHGFCATVFLPSAYIGNSFKNKPCISWQEVRDLSSRNISFGSHTVTHPQLRELKPAAVCRELRDSKKVIEDETGTPVNCFCYPYRFPEEDAAFQVALQSSLEEAGYRYGVTTIIGRLAPGDHWLFMKRLPANTCDDLAFFKAKLNGAYDWLHWPQRKYKAFKSSLASLRVLRALRGECIS